MLREAQSKAVTPTKEEVLGIGAEYCGALDRETRAEVAEVTGPLLACRPVKPSGTRAGGWVALGLMSLWFACSGLSACSGSNPRDQRYGQDSGADFDAPAAAGGAGGASGGTGGTGGAIDTGGTAGSSTGGAAGAAGAGGSATGGQGNGGSAGSAGGGTTGQSGAAGGNGGTAGQTGAPGGNGGAAGATAQATSQNDWTAGRRATKMLLGQVS